MENKPYRPIKFYRFLLLMAPIMYMLFALFYHQLPEVQDPLLLSHRIIFSILFLGVYVLSFVNSWVKQKIDKITYLTAILALIHMIIVNYIQSYSFVMAVSIIVVVIFLNLIFKGDRLALYINIILTLIIGILILLTGHISTFNIVYFIAYLTSTGMAYYISYQKLKKEEKIENINQKQNMLLDTIDTKIWYLKDKETLGKVNRAYAEFMGQEKSELENKKLREVLTRKKAEECIKENEVVFKKKEKYEIDKWLKDSEGKKCFLSITKSPKLDKSGKVEYIVCSAQDITEKKKKVEENKYLLHRDVLTDLYNRRFFEEEMQRLDTKRQLPISIIMADVNGLKIINDSLGHEQGDELLIKTADILKEVVRKEDILARLGGDEFAILLPQTSKKVAQKIIVRIKKKYLETKKDKISVSLALGSATKEKMSQNIEKIFTQADDSMYQDKLLERENVKNGIAAELLDKLTNKSNESLDHIERMNSLAQEFGKRLELADSKLKRLSLLVTLHDIGKITIDERILKKSEKLTEEEWEIIKDHPLKGYRIASAFEEFVVVAEEIFSHHEWWDGSGYPRGLKEDNIPYLARIFSIIDSYDVMIHKRSYSEALSKEEALAEIKKGAGKQFDPKLASEFISILTGNNG